MRKKRLLIVDDERDFALLLKLNLERGEAFEVVHEPRATQVLATVRAFKPDVILLDVIMPDMTGQEVAAQLHGDEELRGIPIVFLTASLSARELDEGARQRYQVLAKPIDAKDVIACINKLLPSVGKETAANGH